MRRGFPLHSIIGLDWYKLNGWSLCPSEANGNYLWPGVVKIKFPEIYVLQELTLCSSVQNAIVFLAGLQSLSWSSSPSTTPGPLPPLPPRSLLTTIQPLHASVAVLASNTCINQADSLNISLLALYQVWKLYFCGSQCTTISPCRKLLSENNLKPKSNIIYILQT